MAKDPQYGTPITPSEASLGLPFNPIYGVTPSNEYIPVQVDSNGVLSSNVIIEGVTVSLGMIKIQDGSGSFLATVDSTGHLYTLSVLADGTNTPYSASNPLRVDPTGTTPQPVTESGIWNITNISGTISLPTGAATESTLSALDTNQSLTNLILGNGTQKTQIVDGSGNVISSTVNSLNVNVTNTEPISGTVTSNQGTPNSLANAWPVELSDGTNLLGTSAHPVRIDPTGTTIQPVSGTVAATQSGVWSNGRTWTLSSGTDSISAAQSGTWNITNISGTISLPTGAATAANQTNASQKTQIVDGSGSVIGPVQTISGTNYAPVVLASSGTTASAVPSRTLQVGGSDGTNLRSLTTDTSGHLLVTSTAATLPSSAGVGQTKIATTGTAVQLASNSLVNGVILSASTNNSANITVGGSGVTNTTDGTGNGYILSPGASVGIAVSNTNSLYINGTSGDVVSFVGS